MGLYLNPPDKAIVLSVDEKSQIQALDSANPAASARLTADPAQGPQTAFSDTCRSRSGPVAGLVRYRRGLFPPIAVLQNILIEHIAPRNDGDKDHNHQAGLYVFRRRRIDLVGGP